MNPIVQQHQTVAVPAAAGPAVIDITSTARDWVAGIPGQDGLLTACLRHASASLAIMDGVSPEADAEMLGLLDRLAPAATSHLLDGEKGRALPAHTRAMLTSVSLSIPIFGGALALGPTQRIVVIEHRQRLKPRDVALHFVGSRR